MHINHGHGQQKTERTIGPAHCHPRLLHAYWVHSCTVMGINNIPIWVVVVYHFWISKCLHMFDTDKLYMKGGLAGLPNFHTLRYQERRNNQIDID